jgi:hypothetical protein
MMYVNGCDEVFQSRDAKSQHHTKTIILNSVDQMVLLNGNYIAIAEHKVRKYNNNVADYSITDTSWRVLKLI